MDICWRFVTFCGIVLVAYFFSAGNGRSCKEFTDVTEYFWANDDHRLTSSQYNVSWQSKVSSRSTSDQSVDRFFTYVDEALLNSRPIYTAFLALLDNFNPLKGKRDSITDAEQREIDTLYSLLTSTVIFKELYSYLECRGHVSSVEDFENKFYSLWFNLYPRSKSKPNILDSCGFEHVMVGELSSSSSISGLHNWIQFYREEASGRLNYYGYVRRVQPFLVSTKFSWNPASTRSKAVKNLGSFFIGTSPQFDLALYTLCAFEFTDAICKVRLAGQTYTIQTWDIAHVSGLQIGSAYPSI